MNFYPNDFSDFPEQNMALSVKTYGGGVNIADSISSL